MKRLKLAGRLQYVRIDRMHSLYRVSLFWVDNVESRASRGNSFTRVPVALSHVDKMFHEKQFAV